MAGIKGTLHDYQYTFLIISRSVLLRMKNFSDKSCRENRNIHFVFNNFFFFFENHFVYKVMLTLTLLTWKMGELIMPANGRWDLTWLLKG